MRNVRKIKIFLLILMLVSALCLQNGSSAQITENELKVTANFKTEEAVQPDAAIEITLSRILQASEKIAIAIEQTDVSNLFTQTENRFVYDSKILPLPVGTSTMTVFLIAPNGDWNELARFPLKVEEKKVVVEESKTEEVKNETTTEEQKTENSEIKKEEKTNEETKKENETVKTDTTSTTENKTEETKTETTENKTDSTENKSETTTEATTETTSTENTSETTTEKSEIFKFIPSLTIGMKSQPFQSNFPAETRPAERATFNDFTMTGSIKTETKFGILTSDSNFDFAGSSFTPETLQFGTLGREAPDVDLSSYLLNVQLGTAKFSLGHTSFGNNRHLVSSFSSRGLSVNIPINKRFDVTAGILNGTSVVGFSNFLGVSKFRHQVQGATLGIEFFPKRQNAMRLEITGFNGYLQALNGVSEGNIVDAEQSRGFGLRFLASDKSERLKVEAGYALSRFFNPQDTTLDPDGNAVALPATLRSAHYAEVSYQIFKDVKLSERNPLNLTFAFKYEYVEPLFRSLGASASADKFSHDYALDGSIGEITFQFAHGRANDNLARVASILRSLTRSNRFSVAFPVTAFFKKTEKPSPFLPRIGYSFDRTNNFGEGIPVNGGFEIDPATIPDLVNTNQTFSSAWQFPKLSVEYTYNRSFADNRQTNAENADNLGWVHGITVGVNPLTILNFNVGFTFDSQKNFQLDQTNRTKTLNFGGTWTMFKGATFTGELSQTLAGDRAQTTLNRNVNYSAQFAYNFSREKSRFKKFGMQAFARFADAYVRTIDVPNELRNITRTKIMTAGMTFNLF